MRIVSTVVLVLIVGNGILNSINALVAPENVKAFCLKNGGLNILEDLKISQKQFIDCWTRGTTEILQEFDNSDDEVDSSLTLYCSKVAWSYADCFNSYFESFKSCYPPGKGSELVSISNFTTSILRFPCTIESLIKDIYKSNDRNCFHSKIKAFRKCGNEIFMFSNGTIGKNPVPEINVQRILTDSESELDFMSGMCSKMQNFGQCSIEAVEECEDKSLTTALDSLFKYIKNYMSCKDVP